MFNQLFPQRLDNTYRGHRLALWLFATVVAVRMLQSVMVIFNGYSIAKSADGIPLDTYPSAAAQTVVQLFMLIGLARLIISLLCVLMLVRYRTAIPLMFTLLILSYLGALLINQRVPTVTVGTPPGPGVGLVLFALMIVGLALSLRSQGNRRMQALPS